MTDVPCGSCHACCVNQRILLEEDEVNRYVSVPTSQGSRGEIRRMVMHKHDSGDCYYLDDNGCSIHGHAPRACRDFDCRDWVKKFDPTYRAMMASDGLDGEVVRSGMRLSA